MSEYNTDVKGLHHAVYRCRDSEETRHFYEDFLNCRLASAMDLSHTKTGREVQILHTFFEMADHSFLAFFEVPEGQSEDMFQPKSDFDLHIALTVESMDMLEHYKQRAQEWGIPVRGPADHGFCHSIYFEDPNGYVVELTAMVESYDSAMADELNNAAANLANWQKKKKKSAQAA